MYAPREHLEFAELYTLIEHSFQKSGMFGHFQLSSISLAINTAATTPTTLA